MAIVTPGDYTLTSTVSVNHDIALRRGGFWLIGTNAGAFAFSPARPSTSALSVGFRGAR